MAKRPVKVRAKKKSPALLVDKALKARWLDALERYRAGRARQTEDWDARYEALADILESEPPYYLAGGYKTARDFLRREAPGEDERSVRTAIRVARHFDPVDEEKYGISKLEALLDYLEAVGGAPLAPAKINLARQSIKVATGKITKARPFADVTRDEIKAATREALGRAGKVARTLPPVVKQVRGLLAKAKLGAIGVRLRDKKLDLTGIALGAVPKLAKVLAAAKLSDI